MSQVPEKPPKVFISYSWSSSEHEAWVVELATDLVESGVDVVLDKWNLREGADKYAFMEKMVTDPSLDKVIVICDRLYAEKADGREGGVGTETQIISQEIYNQVDPTDQKQKFVAVITEKDEEGNPYAPAFLKSRIHIDMSDSDQRAASFETLLRWIYDKPLYKKPELGKPPAFLADDRVSLGTSARFRLAIQALKEHKPSAPGAVRDYFHTFAEKIEQLRIEPEKGKEFDEQVIENLELFLPYRDEIVEMFATISRYRDDQEIYEALHSFFEQILRYGFWPVGKSSWNNTDADNYRVILYELFLYAVAALLKYDRVEGVCDLTEGFYFPPGSPEIKASMVSFSLFNCYPDSLNRRNQRLQLRQLNLMATLLHDRATRSDFVFEDLMQADFILFLRAELRDAEPDPYNSRWSPHTLVYTRGRGREHAFEIFARAQSPKHFERLKIVLGISGRNELENLLLFYQKNPDHLPRWEFDRINPALLMNFQRLPDL